MKDKNLGVKIRSVLCYCGIPALFFINSKNSIVQFHAKQGILLFILAILALFIPIIGWIIFWPFIFINCFIAAAKAWNLKMWSTPIYTIFKTLKLWR